MERHECLEKRAAEYLILIRNRYIPLQECRKLHITFIEYRENWILHLNLTLKSKIHFLIN